MLSVKQGGIKFHFYSLWYDSTWDWTQVSRGIGEHSNRWANVIKEVEHKIKPRLEQVQNVTAQVLVCGLGVCEFEWQSSLSN